MAQSVSAGAGLYVSAGCSGCHGSPATATDRHRLGSNNWQRIRDAINGGNPGLLTLAGMNAVEGGHPILSGGKVIGAIGVSGVTAPQDGVVASAGAAVIN